MRRRRAARILSGVFDLAGALLLLLLGIVLLAGGLADGETWLVVVGGVTAFVAIVWVVVFRARGGSLVP